MSLLESITVILRLILKPIVLLSLLVILTGGSVARFYAYREPAALPSLLLHLSLAILLAAASYRSLYKKYKSNTRFELELVVLLLILLQLGLGSLLGIYRLGLIDLGGLTAELAATGTHFLVSLLVLTTAIIASIKEES